MTFSPTDAAFEGFRLTRREPKMIVALALVYAVYTAVLLALIYYPLGEIMRLASTMGTGEEPSQAQVMSMMNAYGQVVAISFLPTLFVNSIVQSAVMRAVFTPSDNRFSYLRLGKDELRVIAVNLLVTLALGAMAMFGFGVVGVLIGVAMAGYPLLVVLATLLGLAVIAGLLWISVKLCLAVPMTFTEGHIVLAQSFHRTKGHFWPLVGMILLAVVLSLAVSFLGSIVTTPLTMMTGGLTVLENSASISGVMIAALFVWVVLSAILTTAQLLIMYAPLGAAWNALKS